jgi:hypothetical protein
MGILSSVSGPSDFTNWWDQHRNAITNFGVGLASGPTVQQGLALGTQGLASGAQQDDAYATQQKAEAERTAAITATQKALAKYPDLQALAVPGADMGPIIAELFRRSTPGYGQTAQGQPTSDIQNYEYGLSHPGFAETLTQKGGQAETALTPTYGKMTDWKQGGVGRGQAPTVVMQLNKAGQSIATQMPPGVTPIAPDQMAGAKTTATVDAKTAGNARAVLPGAEQAYAITKHALDAVANDPSVKAGEAENFSKFAGVVPQQMLPTLPGTNRANFKNIVDQLSGQAFLNIRQALKGAGQVTDYEGAKGEIAISRMKAAAESGDDAAFKQALLDFNEAIDNGMRLLREQANGAYANDAPAVSTGPSPSGRVLTYNPATGELE